MRKVPFIKGEFYHIYNRGVDKRSIFKNEDDTERFFQSMEEFNVIESIGSIYENSFLKNKLGSSTPKSPDKLVNFVCYCLNPNHYHFILEQVADRGIEKFMHRLGTGYTNYFNNKYDRTGSLFQGRFKAVHIDSDSYLLHTSVYVNLNNRVHQFGNSVSKLMKSSWKEYIGESDGDFCDKDMILGQFENINEYKKFAEESLKEILERREYDKSVEEILIE